MASNPPASGSGVLKRTRTISYPGNAATPPEYWPIPVPNGDIFFDPFESGEAVIPFFRSEFGPTTGVTKPRQQVNFITAWMDGSNVYGSDDETAASLRTFQGGLMKTSLWA